MNASVFMMACAMFASLAQAENLDAMLSRCAPQVHPTTLRALIAVESNGHAFAISDDGPAHLTWEQRKTMLRSFYPSSKDEAVLLAQALLKQGHLVGVGPMQISTRNLTRMGSSLAAALEPCENLRLGAALMVENYLAALQRYKHPQQALLAAISRNNTGSFERGFGNGYVARVIKAARMGKLTQVADSK